MDSKTETGFSSASVIIVLRRRKVYYYLNVFTQFLFLIAIGFMSLTFPVNNFRFFLLLQLFFKMIVPLNPFSDRVMTALTILLVMTCNQQVINVSVDQQREILYSVGYFTQDSLPKTSYFKIIDWILLVSVNSQIVVMIWHTYLYWACQEELNCLRFFLNYFFY